MLLTTQYLEEADQLADRISMLKDGKVVAEGTPDQLKTQLGSDWLDLVLRRSGRGASRCWRWPSRCADGEIRVDGTDGSASR